MGRKSFLKSTFIPCTLWSKDRRCQHIFNFSINLNINYILPSSTNNCSNKKPIGEAVIGRTDWNGWWYIKTLWVITTQFDDFLRRFENSFLRLTGQKKMQHVTNRDIYPMKKECIHWCSVSSVRMTGSKLYPSIDQWWRTLNEHL